MKKTLKIIGTIIIILAIVYLLGPTPATPKYNAALSIPMSGTTTTMIDKVLTTTETAAHAKPNNEAKIIWADTAKTLTEYVLLYLPGFTASHTEGAPIHTNLAAKYGCNLYLARLYGHGLQDTTHTFEDFTVDKYYASAVDALSTAIQLGNKVIIMGTSTGGSLALKLAAAFPNKVHGLILLSPNIAINDPNAWLLNNHWGKQIATLVKGGSTFHSTRQDSTYRKYWNTSYNVNGAVQVEELLETSMTSSTFNKLTQPTCLLYYYQDEAHQDPVVKVSAMKTMYAQLGTPNNSKYECAIPKAANHVIGSYVQSGDLATVQEKIAFFVENIMHIKALK